MFDWLWPVMASLDLSAWTLVYAVVVVIAVLVLDFLIRVAFEVWDRVTSIHGGPHAVDSARIHRETAGELHRLAVRSTSADTRADGGVGGAVMVAAAGVSLDAVGADLEGDGVSHRTGVGVSRGPGLSFERLDRDSEYGRSTFLVLTSPKERVAIEPWLAGRDLV